MCVGEHWNVWGLYWGVGDTGEGGGRGTWKGRLPSPCSHKGTVVPAHCYRPLARLFAVGVAWVESPAPFPSGPVCIPTSPKGHVPHIPGSGVHAEPLVTSLARLLLRGSRGRTRLFPLAPLPRSCAGAASASGASLRSRLCTLPSPRPAPPLPGERSRAAAVNCPAQPQWARPWRGGGGGRSGRRPPER